MNNKMEIIRVDRSLTAIMYSIRNAHDAAVTLQFILQKKKTPKKHKPTNSAVGIKLNVLGIFPLIWVIIPHTSKTRSRYPHMSLIKINITLFICVEMAFRGTADNVASVSKPAGRARAQ